MPGSGGESFGLGVLRQVIPVLGPPLVLVLLVLGSIFAGIATPTEAGALGAVGALGLAFANRRLSRKAVAQASPNDLILLLGKGHERYQIYGDTLIPYADQDVIASLGGRRAE